MRSASRALGALVVGLCVVSGPGIASAQTWAIDRFEPSPAGDVFFASDFPEYARGGPVPITAALLGDYAYLPLVLRAGGQGGAVNQNVIDHMVTLHAQLGVSLLNRVNFHASVPVSIYQGGAGATSMVSARNSSGVNVGDVRVGARARLLGEADRDAFSLHVGAQVFIPVNNRSSNASDSFVRLRGGFTAAGRVSIIRYSLGLGVEYRQDYALPNARAVVGTEGYVTLAVGVVALEDRLTIGPELWLSTTLTSGRPFQYGSNNAEAVLGVHYLVADTVLVGLAGGPGLSQGVGTPTFRGLFEIAYAPAPARTHALPAAPADRDHDGVIDVDDLCPDEPRGEHADPAHRGCPLRDADYDGVYDADDLCPNDPSGEHPDPNRRGCPAPDSDHDGVLDPDDQCPTTPQGEHPDPERRGCPDGDADADGVLDHQDQCPREPAGLRPDPARAGCPIPDRDHDTVPDAVDACPDQPGAPSPDPRRNGCPGLVRVENGQLHILRPVFFATNRDRILPRSFPVLTAVANALTASPEIHRVSVDGHTDNRGGETHNQELSQRRADSVMAWLAHHGIDAARLEAHGYGQSRPIEPNETAAGRSGNRRVEFRITDPAPAASTEAP